MRRDLLAKKPILAIVDEDSDTSKAIKKAGCGWISTPGDTNAVIELMEKAFRTPKDLRFKLGEHGYNYALNNFSKEKNLNLLFSLINSTKN